VDMKCRTHKLERVVNCVDISVHISLWKFMTSDIRVDVVVRRTTTFIASLVKRLHYIPCIGPYA
jgi:hypothetical protein